METKQNMSFLFLGNIGEIQNIYTKKIKAK
jgi:hypothetical protein